MKMTKEPNQTNNFFTEIGDKKYDTKLRLLHIL